jgi:hypothetical protein
VQSALQLRQLLERCRARVAPEHVGLTTRPAGGPGRKAPGLTQSDMDVLTQRSSGTYGRFETGRRVQKPEYANEVAKILGMSEREYTEMYLLLYGHQPPHPLDQLTGMTVPEVWDVIVQGTSHIAYVTNGQWDVLTGNQPFRDCFKAAPPKNLLHWMLFSPEARTGVLDHWRTRWAPFLLAQLQAAHIANPDNVVLTVMHEQALQDRHTGPIYRGGSAPYAHPDGDIRPIRHPRLGRGTVSLAVASPLSSPGSLFVVAPFTPERQPRHLPPA